MLKKVLLVLATLTVLVLGLLVYRQFAGKDDNLGRRRGPGGSIERGQVGQPVGGVRTGVIESLDIRTFDPRTGRPEARYRAASVERKADQRMHLVAPHVELYRRRGETITITAQRGVITGEEIGNRPNPRQGQLEGDVRIRIDRSGGTAPVAAKPGTTSDVIDILIPDRQETGPDARGRIIPGRIAFDNDRLQITAPGRVELFSTDVDIFGEELTIRWDDNPRELRLLRLERGERMVVKQEQDRLRLNPVGSGRDAATSRDRDGANAAPTGSAARRAEDAGSPPAPTVASASPGPEQTDRAASDAPATDPDPADRQQEKRPYLIVMQEDVNVEQGDGGAEGFIRNADRLEMVFVTESGSDPEREGPQPRPVHPTQPSSPPPPGAGGPDLSAATAPAENSPPVQTVITWRGPLEMTPFRDASVADTMPANAYDVQAQGRNMTLGDADTTIACGRFTYRSDTEQARLDAMGRPQVRVTMDKGEQELFGQTVHVDRHAGLARVDGAGELRLKEGDSGSLSSRPSDEPVRITWSDSLLARFDSQPRRGGTDRSRQFLRDADIRGQVLVRHADGSEMTGDRVQAFFLPPADQRRNELDRVEAGGNVHLARAGKDDYVQADRLTTTLARTAAGRTIPTLAVATGNVRARQDGRQIETDLLKIWFVESTPEQLAAGEDPFQPTRLLAQEGVILRDPGQGGGWAEGRTLDFDLLKHEGLLTGTEDQPVRVVQDDILIEGPLLRLTDAQEALWIEGAGRLRFLTDTGLNGEKLDEPMPVDIRWSEGQEFLSRQDSATFTGDVRLDSEGYHMNCGTLLVRFEQVAADEAAQTRPATTSAAAESKPFAWLNDMRGFRNRRIRMVTATDDVAVTSEQRGADGMLDELVKLNSQKLIYDLPARRMEVPSAGTMLVANLRPPEPPKALVSPRVDPLDRQETVQPNQTAFAWNHGMVLRQAAGTAEFDTNVPPGQVNPTRRVRMEHRSGDRIVLNPDWPIRRYERLPAGRSSTLTSDQLLVRFRGEQPGTDTSPAQAAHAQDGALLSGMNLGRLEHFDALGSVELRDGLTRALGHRVKYESELDLAIIEGRRDGARQENAYVEMLDPAGRRPPQTANTPLIHIDLRRGIIDAKNIAGGG